MKRKYNYREGIKARQAFDHAMKRLFKAPKTVKVGRASGARKSAKKSEREGKSE
jgi:hypothetical protein